MKNIIREEMKNFVLLVMAILLSMIIIPISSVIGVIGAVLAWELNAYFFNIAIAIDQFGNVVCKYAFDMLFITGSSTCKFGCPDLTISSVIGQNKIDGTLTIIGKSLCSILDKWLGQNHCINSIGK